MKIGSFIQNIDGSLIGRVHGLGFTTTAVKAEPQRSQSGKNYFRLLPIRPRTFTKSAMHSRNRKTGGLIIPSRLTPRCSRRRSTRRCFKT